MLRLGLDTGSIAAKATEIRLLSVEAMTKPGMGHLGGCLSCAEILSALYFGVMDVYPDEPRHPLRDRFVLSKGHAGPALYAALALRGLMPIEDLWTLNQGGTRLPSHADMRLTTGVDMTAGSLGQGISAACGMAYALRLDGRPSRVYCLLGDGECQEGEVWEAAMSASAYKLDNLCAVVDCNKLQIDGFVADILPIEPLADKWRAFGWNVIEVDGHDVEALLCAFRLAKGHRGSPTCILAHTTKAKGIPSQENRATCHHIPVTIEHLEELRAVVCEASSRG